MYVTLPGLALYRPGSQTTKLALNSRVILTLHLLRAEITDVYHIQLFENPKVFKDPGPG